MSPEALKERRKTLNVSQIVLAKESGVSRFRISLFESRTEPLFKDEVNRIAKALAPYEIAYRCSRCEKHKNGTCPISIFQKKIEEFRQEDRNDI